MDFDFEKNPTVETIEVVPEKYRGLYSEITEGDNTGHYGLSEAAKGLVTDYTGLARSAAGLRQEKKTASDESATRRHELKSVNESLTALGVEIGEEGMIPAIEAFVAGLQEQVKGGKTHQVDLDKIKAQFATQLADSKTDNETSQAGMLATLEKHMVIGDATAAIAEAKGSIPLLLPLVKGQCVVVPNDDGTDYVVRIKDPDGTYRLDAAGNPLTIKGLVTDMKTKEEYQRAFESESKGGSGSPPGSMKTPATNRAAGQGEMSSVEKIREGLKKGQARTGAGASA